MFNFFICFIYGIVYLSFQLKTPAMLDTFEGRRLTHFIHTPGVTP